MVKVTRTFTAGKMNKVVDERLLPAGEYVDAQNMRLGSTEDSEVGSIELTRGNAQISNITFNGTAPSGGARCIGAIEDTSSNRIYWFINDPTWTGNGGGSPITTTILDMVVSMDTDTGATTYHLISVQEGTEGRSTLNFNLQYLITGVNLVDDLLFWTDNLNPPRCININQGYLAPTITAGVVTSSDNFSAEEIRVIVRPPINAPLVGTSLGAEQFNFLEERFISFAYRYRYESGEYSATSQFSNPAFVPNNFQFSPQSFLNEGMTNRHNVATITCDSGSSLVKSVELLWKNNDNGIIKVMERIKKDGSIPDNSPITRSFNTSKILTVLPDSEILRLYDNVPRWAKAQTLMGNRLVYGNYIENYDLKVADEDDSPLTNICYETSLVTTEIGEQFLDGTSSTAVYTYGGPNVTLPNGMAMINMSPVATTLSAGSILTMSIGFNVGYIPNVDYFQIDGTAALNPAPINSIASISSVPEQFNIELEYVLPESYTGVAALVASPNFQAVLGTLVNQPMATACGGYTWTDIFTCNVPLAYNTSLDPATNPPYNLYRVDFGIDVAQEGITATSAGDNLFLQFPCVRYCQTPGDSITDTTAYNMYYRILDITVGFATSGAPPSLHSNRGYEVGIVYMDAFKRATTAFTSLNNVVHVGCTNSYLRNQIAVTIPTQQVAPWWAQTYKFVVKPSEATYETIFGNIVFRKPGEADAYILLEGENMRKVEEGTRLIVKSDMGGPVDGCNYITVLEKKAQEEGFIIVPLDPADPGGPSVGAPAGVYMKIKASGVDLTVPPDAITTTGWKSKTRSGGSSSGGPYPVIKLGPEAFNQEDDSFASGFGAPIPLPAGSRVRMEFKFTRKGKWGGGGYCERRKYKWQPDDFFVGDDYENVIEWFNAENIPEIIQANNGSAEVGNSGACDIDNYVYTVTTNDDDALDSGGNECVNAYRWFISTDSTSLDNIKFLVRGTHACGTVDKAKSKVEGEITIFRATNLLIFETLPTNALPDVWYEGADNYAIGADGNHLSGAAPGDTNQDIATGVAGQVLLSNFNCYSFGNGCESYTIRDSVEGDSFSLGNRVTATASQDYGKAHRFADLTYSGVYNDFSNVNKLNEFNLGLLNFKPLEDSFGPVQKLVGRKSDILVLQEDKISYVLAGKNLLSDSTGGGAVTATPTVLGTQIARLEEYGIGYSPESYAEYGYDKFFTDEKRGAVIKLTGGSHSTESLEVISEYGLRSWFRDLFIAERNDFKLGGYDPYMNEYVLNSTDIQHPVIVPCVPCDTYQEITPGDQTWIFCVELGQAVGSVTIETSFLAIIQVTYNGVTTSGVGVTSFTFSKGSQNPTTASINVFGLTSDAFGITIGCVVPIPLIVRRVVVNSPQYGLPDSELVHNQFSWNDGSFTSDTFPDNSSTSTSLLPMPLSLTGNCFRWVTSLCSEVAGNQGEGPIPTDGSSVTVMSNTLNATDDFTFDPAIHRMGLFRSSTLFNFDCADSAQLITILNSTTWGTLNPEQVSTLGTLNSTTIAMPAPTGFPNETDILYVVYDYRNVVEKDICHVASATEDTSLYSETCCECNCPTGQNTTYELYTNATQSDGYSYITFAYYNGAGNLVNQALVPGSSYTLCVSGTVSPLFPIVLGGYESVVDIAIVSCNCT